jgi:tetratricopeptide (TPR) repeat protein
MFELKPLHREALPAALKKAERYRLLNEPLEAESICLDVLEVDPDNADALVTLLLALSDQFERRLGDKFNQARALLERFGDEYSRRYYEGILCERRAKVSLGQGGPGSGSVAYEWFRQAMDHYERALAIRPERNDDTILRWNTCARILNRNPNVVPDRDEISNHMLE